MITFPTFFNIDLMLWPIVMTTKSYGKIIDNFCYFDVKKYYWAHCL